MRISQDAFDKIVEWEVGSKAQYERRYRHPERPGGQSGITIGIGYDVGYSTAARLRSDWGGLISDAMINALVPCCGVTGVAAQALLDSVKSLVDVPWDAAMAVYEKKDIPKWENVVLKALPNADLLSPDCLGALVSLAYNRGPSFSLGGDRFAEMRAIRDHMEHHEFDKIPDELRNMKRIWAGQSGMRGLLARRDEEAALFERGLKAGGPVTKTPKPKPAPVPTPAPKPPDVPPPEKKEPKSPTASKTIWAQIIAVLTALGGALSDWRVLAVLVIAGVAAFVIYERLKKDDIAKPAWLAKLLGG